MNVEFLDAFLPFCLAAKEFDCLRALAKVDTKIRKKMKEMRQCGRLAYVYEYEKISGQRRWLLNGRSHRLDGPASSSWYADRYYSHDVCWARLFHKQDNSPAFGTTYKTTARGKPKGIELHGKATIEAWKKAVLNVMREAETADKKGQQLKVFIT